MLKVANFLAKNVVLFRAKALNFKISQIYHGAPLLLQQKRRAMVDPL